MQFKLTVKKSKGEHWSKMLNPLLYVSPQRALIYYCLIVLVPTVCSSLKLHHAEAEDRRGLRQRRFRHRVDSQVKCVLNEGWKINGQKAVRCPVQEKKEIRKGQKIKVCTTPSCSPRAHNKPGPPLHVCIEVK